jgi:hypothetical protein
MRTLNKWQLVALFIAGVFFGGALDHILFAAKGSGTSHYGYEIGVNGNWLMSLLDTSITAILIWLAFRKTKSYKSGA